MYPAPIGYAPAPIPVSAYPNPYPYSFQTGYESAVAATDSPPANNSDYSSFFQSLIPSSVFGWMFRTFVVAATAVSIFFFSGAITTILCTLTPLCTISFRTLSFLKSTDAVEKVGQMIGNEITPERVRRVARFANSAIKKFSDMQSENN